MSTKHENMVYSKVIINIPKKLITEFDVYCSKNGYSRPEGIKEAMRRFLK